MRHSRSKQDSAAQDGFALVAVLWAGLLLALLAAGFASAVRAKLRTTAANVETARAQGIADAAINIAILEVLNARAGQTSRFAPATTVACTIGDANVVVEVEDDEGKVNLNTAPPELLAALFEGAGASAGDAKVFAARIADFRDSDDERSTGGAEREDYVKAGVAHGPSNGPFLSASELDQVLGVPPLLTSRVQPYLTTALAHTGVDPAVAPQGLREILSRGSSAFIRSATSDDNSSIFADRDFPAAFAWQSSRQAYTVRAAAALPGGTRYTSETAFTLQPGGQPIFRYWQRGLSPATPRPVPTNSGPC